MFPAKTDPITPQAPEAGLLITRKGMIKDNGVHVPICDVAGEVSDYLNDSGEGNSAYERISSRAASINRVVIDTVRDCQGFIVALDANDSIMFRKSPEDIDSDNYMHNVLTNIFEWRRRTSKADPHIIVVLTKWDQVSATCKELGMDAYDGEDGL